MSERFADYALVDTLQSFDHASVHLARPPGRLGIDDEVVELKVLGSRGSDEDFKRFANEIRLLNSLSSPYLVELLEAGRVAGSLFLVTRHHRDGTLAAPRVALDGVSVIGVVADAARGAHALHELGVAHRDLRPDSVALADGRGRVRDLGLAEMAAGMSATLGAGPIGSLVYGDPRLLASGTADRSTDIWSLGMVLHDALGGAPPYGPVPTDSLLAALRHLVQTEPSIDPALDGDVRDVIGRCLAPPGRRFTTAADLADALDGLVRSRGGSR